MDSISTILQRIPLFRHCTEEEVAYLRSISKTIQVQKGHSFDLKTINALNIIVTGMFEIDALGKNDILYLAQGSFFGIIPFTDNVHRGKVKAVADSTLLFFDKEELLKFFLIYYKALRGYLRAARKLGFTVTDVGSKYFGEQKKVITVFSKSRKAGKSLFSALIGSALSKKGKTIILDLSYSGDSLFTIFDAKITSPLSHKQVNGPSSEEQVFDRIERVDDDLHLVNVSFGSKVRVEPDILSPLLFVLSREYKYIVMDVSDIDESLRNKAFALSDIIYALLKNKKDTSSCHRIFDKELDEAQRIYYILNEFYSGKVRNFTGGFIFEKLELKSDDRIYPQLSDIIESGSPAFSAMIDPVYVNRRALVIESLYFDAVFLSGFFSALSKSGVHYDAIYTSSLSYIMLALFQLSQGEAEFKKNVSSIFTEDRINRFLEITFPGEYVFKNNNIVKTAQDLCGNTRLEMFSTSPVALLSRDKDDKRRIMSTGFLKDIFSASFMVYPLFESINIAQEEYSSGFPSFRVSVEDLFRTDSADITYVAVQNNRNVLLKKDRVLPFYRKYVTYLEGSAYNADKINTLADTSHILPVTQKNLDMNEIFSETEKASEVFFAKKPVNQ